MCIRDSRNYVIDAGEDSKLVFDVVNDGDVPAYNVTPVIEEMSGIDVYKRQPYAAQMAAQDCAKVAFDLGLRKVKAYVKGPGNGRCV